MAYYAHGVADRRAILGSNVHLDGVVILHGEAGGELLREVDALTNIGISVRQHVPPRLERHAFLWTGPASYACHPHGR